MSDDYLLLRGQFKLVTEKAMLMAPEYGPEELWIPRSLLHASDDRALDGWDDGDAVALRVREWFLKKNGLL